MKRLSLITAIALLGFSFVLLATPKTASAHEQENFVDWTVGYDNLDFAAPPVFSHPGGSINGVRNAQGVYPTITLDTGDQIVVTFTFDYIGDRVRRGDLF